MIRINLLGEKIDRTGAQLIQLLVLLATLTLSVVVCFVFYDEASTKLANLRDEEALARQQLAKLQRDTKEVRDLEEKEGLLKEKLSTIALLKARKHGPVHLLHELAKAIPDEAWIVEITEKEDVLSIVGAAMDNHTISDFMARLAESEYFEAVDLVQSELFVYEEVIGRTVKQVASIKSSTDRALGISKGVRKVTTRQQDLTRDTKLKKFSVTAKIRDPLRRTNLLKGQEATKNTHSLNK